MNTDNDPVEAKEAPLWLICSYFIFGATAVLLANPESEIYWYAVTVGLYAMLYHGIDLLRIDITPRKKIADAPPP